MNDNYITKGNAQPKFPLRGTEGRLIVIGGGAAGFFCAINAARMSPNLQVTIVEKTNKLLSKVKVSGGGRCNLTHALFDIAEMSKRYPRGQHFVKKAFHQFFTTDTIQWFKERNVIVKAESDGRMFPLTDSSQTIIDCLMHEANQYGVAIRMNFEVKDIAIKDGQFIVHSPTTSLSAGYICVASGGYPKTAQFQWLKNMGHTIAEPVPSLFTFNLPQHPITQLMGVSANLVKVKIEGSKLVEEGPVLITHWGLSGPAILRLSAWGARELSAKSYHFKAHINWLPQCNETDMREDIKTHRKQNGSKRVYNHNVTGLPQRLWVFLLVQSDISDTIRWADLPAKKENQFIQNLLDYTVEVKGKTTFKEEFVTAGGISLNEVDSYTMMSKKIPNLFFAGEVLDVDGITGGFNFQHAWTSGWIAAKRISEWVNSEF